MPTGTRPAPPADTCRVAMSGTIASMPWAVILWLQLTASTRVAADLASVLGVISSAWNTNVVPQVGSPCVLNQIQGVWITPGGGEIVATNSTVRTGSNGSALIGNVATAVVVNWHIDQYYRGGKPRSYLPGLTSANSTDSVHLTATGITNFTTAAGAMITAINAATAGGITQVRLGTVSFQRANEWRSPPVFYPYNSATVRSTLGVQRRRLLA